MSRLIKEINLFEVNEELIWTVDDFIHHQEEVFLKASKVIEDFYKEVTQAIGE